MPKLPPIKIKSPLFVGSATVCLLIVLIFVVNFSSLKRIFAVSHGYAAAFESSNGSSEGGNWNAAGTWSATAGTISINAPQDIALSSTGDIYITNYGNNTITVLNPDGTASTTYSSAGSGPIGIAISPSTGDIYIANNNVNTITVLNPDGTASTTYGSVGLNAPYGIAISPSTQDIYVSNYDGNNIVVLNPNGTASTTYTPSGLNGPAGIALSSSQNVYVANSGSNDILFLNPDGSLSATYGPNIPIPGYVPTEGIDYPGPDDYATINQGTIILTQNQSVDDLTLAAGGTLDLNGHTLNVGGNWANTGGTLIDSSASTTGTINMVGNGAQRISGTNIFPNLTKIVSGSATTSLLFDITATTTILNTLTLSGTHTNFLTIGTNGLFPPVFINQIGTTTGPRTGFSGPSTVALSSTGDIYVADTGNNRIVVLNPNGTASTTYTPSQLNDPQAIALSSTGDIYVANTGNSNILVLNPNGTVLATYDGQSSSTLGQIVPQAVAISSTTGDIYLADLTHNRIVVLNPNGTASTTYNGLNFSFFGIAFSSTGDIYLPDQGNNRIVVLNPNGTASTTYSSVGLNTPVNITLSSTGDIYVTNYDASNIVVLNPDGTASTTYYDDGILGNPTSVAISLSGDIYVATGDTDKVVVLNPDGTASTTYNGQQSGLFSQPRGIARDSSDNIYVSDNNMGNIQKFDSRGNFIKFFSSSGNLESPIQLAADANNNIYVADNNGSIVEYNSNGDYLRSNSSIDALTGGIAVDSSGNIYVSTYFDPNLGGTSGVIKLDQNFDIIATTTSANGESFNFGETDGLTLDKTGTYLYLADVGNNRIVEFNASDLSYVSQTTGPQGESFNGPQSIALDSNNNVYVSDVYNNRIVEFSPAPNYTFLTQWGINGSDGDGEFEHPQQIITDSKNNIYVADEGGDVQEFAPSSSTPSFNIVYQPSATSTGTTTFSDLNVQDSTNASTLLDSTSPNIFSCQYCTDQGGNTNWFFNPLTITGLAITTPATKLSYFINDSLDISGLVVTATYNDGLSSPIAFGVGNILGFNSSAASSSDILSLHEGGYTVTYPVEIFTRTNGGGGPQQPGNPSQPSSVTASISASSTSVATGGSTNISWFSTNANSCSVTANGLAFATGTSSPTSYNYNSTLGSAGSGAGQFEDPFGVAVDASGNIYVADGVHVEKFNSSGVYVSQFGSAGSGDGQFGFADGIATDASGNIYVTDSENARVEKFSSSGVYLSQFGSYGSGNGQFLYPEGIAVDASGNIYVTDYYNSRSGSVARVEKFNSSGVYLSQFGSYGSGNGQFYSPIGIAFDASGNIYVTDSHRNNIEKFNSSGVYVSQFAPVSSGGEFGFVGGIATDASGNVYVTDSFDGNPIIAKFNSSGVYLSQFGSYGSGNGQFASPFGIAVDASGNLYVTDYGNSTVQKFSAGFSSGPLTSDTTFVLSCTGASGLATKSVTVNVISSSNPHSPSPARPTLPPGFCFNNNLYPGMIDPDVKDLQIFLNTDTAHDFSLAASGSGSLGEESDSYDSLTTAAVQKFQTYYGIISTGNFGTTTRQEVNGILGCAMPIPTIPTSPASSTPTRTIPTQPQAPAPSIPPLPSQSSSSAQNTISSLTESAKDGYKQIAVLSAETIKKLADAINNPAGSVVTKTLSTLGVVTGLSLPLVAATTLSDFWLILARLFGFFLEFLGIRKKNRPWGTVYDSVTKRPLDPVLVTLINIATGQQAASSITDFDGRYGFLVSPGTYRITVNKTNYTAPSDKMKGKTFDEVYNDLYFGENIIVSDEATTITKNIPMDPVSFNWNEFVKTKMDVNKFIKGKDITWARISTILFVAGALVSLLAVIFVPQPYNFIIAGLYVAVYLFNYVILAGKKAGSIIDNVTHLPLSFGIVEIFREGETAPFTKKITDKFGSYYALVPSGRYFIKISKKNDDESYTLVSQTPVFDVAKGVINMDMKIV